MPLSAQALRQQAKALLADKTVKQKQLAEEADIKPPQLNRFLGRDDEQGLSEEAMQRLANAVATHLPANPNPLPKQHAHKLARLLRDEQLVLFVGAGLSHLAPAKDGSDQRLPLWGQLTQQVAINVSMELDEQDDPIEFFDDVIDEHDKGTLLRQLDELLDDRSYNLSTAHEALKPLPWQAIYTTNYDNLLGRLLNQSPISNDKEYLYVDARKRPQLFQIHGDLRNPHTLTASDYDDWADKHPQAWRQLERMLAEKTILFVGYGLGDPHLTHLLREVRRVSSEHKNRFYAWTWQADDKAIKRFERRHRIEAVSLNHEQDYSNAFTQLSSQLAALENTELDPATLPEAADDYSHDRQRYCAAMLVRHNIANLKALYLPGPGYSRDDFTLEEIFVHPDLLVTVTEPVKLADRAKDNPKLDEPDETAPTTQTDEEEQESLREQHNRQHSKQERQPAERLLSDQKLLVILGAPGQGKTTLLRWWLLQRSRAWQQNPEQEPFPVFIRLSDWETNIQTAGGCRLLTWLQRDLPHVSQASLEAAQFWTNHGRPVLWLLDGIDEIRDRQQRLRLREELHELRQQRPQDRFIVSSRPAGYSTGSLGSDWQATELAELTSAQTRQVLTIWAKVLEKKEGFELDADNVAQQLEKQVGMRAAAHNALLLTLVVLFYKAKHKLPQQRWEFYCHAAETLVYVWNRHRFQSEDLPQLPSSGMEGLLEHLALDGLQSGRVGFGRRQVAAKAEALLKTQTASQLELDAELQRILRASEDLVGVFIARGPDSFGFLHLSFQEFYAARSISKLQTLQRRALIVQFWDHPDWQETWALYALSLQGDLERLEELLATISAAPEHTEQPLNTLLFRREAACLRLLGIGDRPVPESLPVWTTIEQKIMAQLHGSTGQQERALSTLMHWEHPHPLSLINAVVKLTSRTPTWKIHTQAIQLLANAIEQPNVLHAIINASEDNDESVRQAAIQALANAIQQPKAIQAIINAAEDEPWFVREAAIQALANATEQPSVLQAIINAAEDYDEDVRQAAIQTLANTIEQPNVLQTIINAAEDESWFVRRAAIQARANAIQQPNVLQAIINATEDNDEHVRRAAVQALANAIQQPNALQAIINAAEDESWFVRQAAIQALANAIQQPNALQVIINAAEDKSWFVRQAVVQALANAIQQPSALQAIVNAAEDDLSNVRQAAVQVLANAIKKPNALQAIINAAEDNDEHVRQAAIQALANAIKKPNVLQAIINAAEDNDEHVRQAAIQALANAIQQPNTLQAIINAAEDKSWFVRQAAVQALANTIEQPNVLQTIINAAEDYGESVRQAAVQALANAIEQPNVLQTIINAAEDESWNVRQAAAQALANAIQQPNVLQAIINAAEDSTEDVRQAAVQALEEHILQQKFGS